VPQTNNFLFKSLNNQQLQAVKHVYGPLLVVAGAGSGKTKALTHRIANLIEGNSIDPYNILAVTFTNKAAKEMKARLEVLLAQELAFNQFGQPWTTLKEIDQNQLRTNVNQERLQNLWIGTFHSLFSRLLRYDIEKYTDPEGLNWTRQFSIYDETDSQTLVKEIISQDMNLDPKRYDPKKIKRLISNAKNQCLTSNDLLEKADNNFDETNNLQTERLKMILDKDPICFNHNLETVERLQKAVRRGANYKKSISLLKKSKDIAPHIQTKSGIMLGLGETLDEVKNTIYDLKKIDCDQITIGQYLRPSFNHLAVKKYWDPSEFEYLYRFTKELGFKKVSSGPLVRSSYHAG